MAHKKGSKVRRKHVAFLEREYEACGGKCPYCKTEMTWEKNKRNSVTFDHILSKKRGGTNALSNGAIMCAECNNRKGSHSLEFFISHRLWEIPRGPHFTLLMTQRHVAYTGDVRAMRAMGGMCISGVKHK